MALMQTDGVITRTELALSDLAFTPANGYFIARDSWGPGEVSHRSTYVSSPYVIGQTLVHSVKDLQTSTLRVRVEGADQDEMYERLDALCVAFEQFSYELTIVINGEAYTYACNTANYSVGDDGNLQDLWLRSNMQVVTFEVPHTPKQSGFR